MICEYKKAISKIMHEFGLLSIIFYFVHDIRNDVKIKELKLADLGRKNMSF